MRPGKVMVRISMLVILIGILTYLGVGVYQGLTESMETVPVYEYTAEETVETSGVIFRDETVIPGSGALAEILAAEGSRVAAGDVVARIYASQEDLESQRELDGKREQMEQLEYVLQRSMYVTDVSGLDEEITGLIVELRALSAGRELSGLAEVTEELRTLSLYRDHTYNSGSSLEAEIAQLKLEIKALEAAAPGYTAVAATASGVFSALVDGYEGVLTSAVADGLTPSGLASLLEQRETVDAASVVGKTISGYTWYYACTLTEEEAERLAVGTDATLRFAGGSRGYTMEVYAVSAAENGQVAVVFTSDSYLSEVSLLRDQTADIIYDTVTALRVPKRAVRVNSETGELGVYRVSGSQAEWVTVRILWREDDFYLVESVLPDNPTTLEEAEVLRAGDTVIASSSGIYEGKVVDRG